ncbi:MAG: flagellar motor switch protein FliN [Desulfobacterales bacterium]|nr:MAG: flagellar motor switch protein FliN [Desulfobacterales bacterium]
MDSIQNFDIRAHIIESITEVFDTMVSLAVQYSEAEPPDNSAVNRMAGAVNFAGDVIGIVTFHVAMDFARLMTARTLGSDVAELTGDEEVKDLIAEISNIIGGNLKSAFNDAGYPCVISTPSITYGTDFAVESLGMQRFERFVFSHGEDTLLVEVGIKAQQSTPEERKLKPTAASSPQKQIDFEKVNALDLKAKLSESVCDVFDTMLSMKLAPADMVKQSDLEGIRNVGSVSLAGDVTGLLNLQVSKDFARHMTANMLGIAVEAIESDEEVRDMLAELSNIVGGQLKSAFTDAGLLCALSTPSFTTGSDFKIESLNMERYERLAFHYQDNCVFVEMGMKISELLQIAGQVGVRIHYEVEEEVPVAAEQTASPEEAASTSASPAPPAPAVEQVDPVAPSSPPGSNPAVEGGVPNDPEGLSAAEDIALDLILDIPLEITVELGRTRIQIQELLKLGPGSAITLAKLEGEPVDILANDTLIARGEVVVENQKYGVRVTEITSRMERIKSLG